MSTVSARPLAAVAPAPVEWLWEPYLARGKLATLDGDTGAGKSLFALDLAARLSTAAALPDGTPLPRPHTTLFLAGKDGVADTLRPRADAAGADLERVIVADAPFRLPDDQPALEELVCSTRADLVVFDAMYSLAEVVSVKADWGHSCNVVGVELCQLAGVRHLCLFHHEPASDDQAISDVLAESRRFEEITRSDRPMQISAAYDGMEISL